MWLREAEQQEAAVAYQKTVLGAWQEIDDALTQYAAQRQQVDQLMVRARSAEDAYQLAKARYDGGAVDYLSVLDSQRTFLQARRDLANAEGQLSTQYVMIQKALGNIAPMMPAGAMTEHVTG